MNQDEPAFEPDPARFVCNADHLTAVARREWVERIRKNQPGSCLFVQCESSGQFHRKYFGALGWCLVCDDERLVPVRIAMTWLRQSLPRSHNITGASGGCGWRRFLPHLDCDRKGVDDVSDLEAYSAVVTFEDWLDFCQAEADAGRVDVCLDRPDDHYQADQWFLLYQRATAHDAVERWPRLVATRRDGRIMLRFSPPRTSS